MNKLMVRAFAGMVTRLPVSASAQAATPEQECTKIAR